MNLVGIVSLVGKDWTASRTVVVHFSIQPLNDNHICSLPQLHALPDDLLLVPTGILFVLFIGWIKFPHHLDNGGLVPNKGVATPTLAQTAGQLSFHWQPHVGTLIGGFITFLYLVRLLPRHRSGLVLLSQARW